METVFNIQAISKVYPMGGMSVRALEHVGLELGPGEIVVLLGASDGGKSTLLGLMGGLDTPTSGFIVYRDHDLSHAGDRGLTRFRWEHVGFVFQSYSLIPSLTARKNVTLVTDIAEHPLDPTEALNKVGIGTLADNFPPQMSSGEWQRVAIARAVARRPDVLLCDEPIGALDFRTGQLVLEMLEQVNRKFGTLIMIITHNAVIADMTDRVVRMSDGTIVEHRRNGQRARVRDLVWWACLSGYSDETSGKCERRS